MSIRMQFKCWKITPEKFQRWTSFSCLSNDVVLVPDPWICQSVCLSVCLSTKLRLAVKTVKASNNMSNVSYKSCTFL